MLPLQTGIESYWTDDFEVTEADLEFLYNVFLEEETPLRTPDLIQRLISYRIENEVRSLQKQLSRGEMFQPSGKYKVGQTLIFPAFGFQSGKVVEQRPGENPAYGDFTVLDVEFEDGKRHEFASDLKTEHKLNNEGVTAAPVEEKPDPAKIYQKYKRALTPRVVDALREDDDTLFITGRWFLKSLLVNVNVGVLNLAEAVLDLSDGGPLETLAIAEQIGFGQDANPILRGVSLDYALSKDDRFDEVGPAGKVWWFLKRMEPKEILEPPTLLRYQEIAYNPDALSDELFELALEIDDELTVQDEDEDDELEDTATITLTYPHWRMGTLPLTQRVEHLFPVAYRAPRIRTTLIDARGKREMDGWIVREFNYVYGLGDFYERYQLPVGAYIKIQPDEDPSRLIIDFDAHKARQEWIWVAKPGKERLLFEEGQQHIGAAFDDQMILGAADLDGIDALADKYRHRTLSALLIELIEELSQFSPQRHVHAKTLYSAVNILRRCPPAPIFATLRTQGNFVNTGGPYWRLA